MLWPWMCGAGVSRRALSSSRADRGGQQQNGPASIWQHAEVLAIVKRSREATRSSAFACELQTADSPRPSLSSAISAISAYAWFQAGQDCNSKVTSCNIQASSVTAVLVWRIIEYFETSLTPNASSSAVSAGILVHGVRSNKQNP